MNANVRHALTQHYAQIFQENPDLLQRAADTLLPLFIRSADEPVYSVGFQRWQKLTKRQRVALTIQFDFETQAIIDALQTQTAQELLAV